MPPKIDVRKVCVAFLFLTVVSIFISVVSALERATPTTKATESTDPSKIALKPSTKYSASSLPGVESSRDVKVISSNMFSNFVHTASNHPRKRKMNDLTKQPESNSMQTLVNTWINGSYSSVHRHEDYSEAFVILEGALAFFTFDNTPQHTVTCHILSNTAGSDSSTKVGEDRVIIVEKGQWHAMTAAPQDMGYPGYAIIFETSSHVYDTTKATKILAPFAPVHGDGMDGDPSYFAKILKSCKTRI